MQTAIEYFFKEGTYLLLLDHNGFPFIIVLVTWRYCLPDVQGFQKGFFFSGHGIAFLHRSKKDVSPVTSITFDKANFPT